jgi:hypothetical protein
MTYLTKYSHVIPATYHFLIKKYIFLKKKTDLFAKIRMGFELTSRLSGFEVTSSIAWLEELC